MVIKMTILLNCKTRNKLKGFDQNMFPVTGNFCEINYTNTMNQSQKHKKYKSLEAHRIKYSTAENESFCRVEN